MEREISPQKNRAGFTLIEVVIATFLLVTALVGLASVSISVIKGNDFSRALTTATTLAKDKMEELKTATSTQSGYTALSVGGPYSDPVAVPYTRNWTVAVAGLNAPDNDPTKMKKITVTVTWKWNNQDQAIAIDTIISKPG